MVNQRWWWSVVLVTGILTGSTWPRQEPGRHWLSRNGTDWQQMSPDARVAYVEGFLAGAAVSQAAAGAHDSAAVKVAIEKLKREDRLRFPFGANVYTSRINDFYWWKDHVPLPTWHAFLEVNANLGRPVADTLP
jgi:hypothetical protein